MKYAIVVAYSDEDEGYVATVPELPGCSAFGRKIPEPIVEKTFKGRFPLRIPEDVRRRLELEARRKGVSLNQLILQRIA
jgi:hypothetical protein